MPVTKVKIRFASVKVLEDCDLFGVAEWHFDATIDGKRVGSRATEFDARNGDTIELPEADWSAEVDVSGKGPGDKIAVTFSGIEEDFLFDDDLGRVTAEFTYPFNRPKTIRVASPEQSGGFFFSAYRAYQLEIEFSVVEVLATTDLTGPRSIPVTRQGDGTSTFTTVGGNALTPRVEVCPVIPVPANGVTRLPPRPVMPAGLAPAATPNAAPFSLTGGALNAMVNPAVIPIIAQTHPDFANRVARLAVTYVEPGNLDLNMLTWHVVSGPATIVGRNRGGQVRVRGTGNAADTIATFEVRWDEGQVLATYRAWVGKVGTVPYRINLLDGRTAGSRVSATLRTPAIAQSHIDVCKIIYWQAGLLLVPDSDNTAYDGAVAAPGNPGIFTVRASRTSHTRNVNPNRRPAATRYNFNPDVVNIVFIHSISGGSQFGVATDIQGIPMANVTDSGTPSNSWVLPSGIPPDGGAGSVKMKTFAGERSRVKQPGPGDRTYVRARNRSNPPFARNDMNRLHAAILPATWGGSVESNGVNLAHELGHVLGLMHRGSGGMGNLAGRKLSDDRVNSKDLKGKQRGHPWLENVMSYGYGGATNFAKDIDLLQASVIRQHPSVKY